MYLLKRFLDDRFLRVNEILRQHAGMMRRYINLIASASYPFPEVLQAQSMPMTVFPMEGARTRRYFPATKTIDEVEVQAEHLTRDLFGVGQDYSVSIQPHSGTQANQIVFNALLRPGDKILSLAPSHGGHISHTVGIGKRNFVVHYSLDSKGMIDYDQVQELAHMNRPRVIVAGTSSFPRSIDFHLLGQIAQSCGAFLHADISHTALFVMTGHHPSAFPYADTASFNMIKNLRGPSGGVLIYRNRLSRKINYGEFPMTQGGPNQNILLAKLVALERLSQMDLNSFAAKIIKSARIISSRLSVDGHKILTGGTDSHLLVVDLSDTPFTGLDMEKIHQDNLILVNRNLIPEDTKPPWIASGIRIGTNCISTLNYTEDDTERLAKIISSLLTPGSSDLMERSIELLDKYQLSIAVCE